MNYIAEQLKTALIKSEVSHRGAADAETVEMILDSLSIINEEGQIVSREGGKPLDLMFDALKKTNPDYFAAPKSTVILDPAAPGFNLTAALSSARNDPELHAELMARLAPRPMSPRGQW